MKSIAWNLYKHQYLLQCLVWRKFIVTGLDQCTSKRKLFALNNWDEMNEALISAIQSHHGFKSWWGFLNSNQWVEQYTKTGCAWRDMFHEKRLELGL